MNKEGCEAPGQTLGKEQPDMTPRPHVAHYRQPPQPLDEQSFERIVVRNGPYGVRQQLDFVALLSDIPADQKVVCRTIFESFVAAEGSQTRARGDNRLTEGKLDPIQLPRDKNTRKKIAHHANRLQVLR